MHKSIFTKIVTETKPLNQNFNMEKDQIVVKNDYEIIQQKLDKCSSKEDVIELRKKYFYDKKNREYFEKIFGIKQSSLPSKNLQLQEA